MDKQSPFPQGEVNMLFGVIYGSFLYIYCSAAKHEESLWKKKELIDDR
jgi:hypothetical protein